MAKFTPGAIVSEIRNKIAATVFSKNAAGAMIRNRVTPINPSSVKQTLRRQQLSSLASGWRGLTQAQRDAWNAASPSFPVQDNLGQTIFLTGEQLYIRSNANALLIGAAAITAAPAPVSFDTLALSGLTATDLDVTTLSFTPTVPTGYAMVVRATPAVSAGKEFVSKSQFRFLKSIAAAQTSPQVLSAEYLALYGSLAGKAGQKIFMEAFLVHIVSGLAGQKVRVAAIVS